MLSYRYYSCEPKEVEIEDPVLIQQGKCGIDGTMFLTDMGCLLACGNNENNKLGLNNRQGFLMAMKNIFAKVGQFYTGSLQLGLYPVTQPVTHKTHTE